MDGRSVIWRRAVRDRRVGSWNVRLRLAEGRLRQELAWRYAR